MYRLLCILLMLNIAAPIIAKDTNGELSGKITSKKGHPLSSAVLVVIQNSVEVARVMTEPTGQYLINPLAAGKYNIEVKVPGFKSSHSNAVTIKAGRTTHFNKKLSPDKSDTAKVISDYPRAIGKKMMDGMRSELGELAGQVLDTNRNIIPKVTVALAGDTGIPIVKTTDSGGYYIFPSLTKGPYNLSFSAAGFHTFVNRGIDPVPGTLITMDIRLIPSSGPNDTITYYDAYPFHVSNRYEEEYPDTLTLLGKIVNESNLPVPFANVTLWVGSAMLGSVETDSNGDYVISNLLDITYDLKVTKENYNISYTAGLKILQGPPIPINRKLRLNTCPEKAAGDVRIDRPNTGKLTIHVVDTNEKSIPSSGIILMSGKKIVSQNTTDASGYYELTVLAPGDYEIRNQYRQIDLSVLKPE